MATSRDCRHLAPYPKWFKCALQTPTRVNVELKAVDNWPLLAVNSPDIDLATALNDHAIIADPCYCAASPGTVIAELGDLDVRVSAELVRELTVHQLCVFRPRVLISQATLKATGLQQRVHCHFRHRLS